MFGTKKNKVVKEPEIAENYHTITVWENSNEFDFKVSEQLKKGWMLVGGVSTCCMDGAIIYSQSFTPESKPSSN